MEQKGLDDPGQAVAIQGVPVVPEGAMTVQKAPGSEDGQDGNPTALPVIAVRDLTKVYILG